MKIMARLAYCQLKVNRSRSVWTLAGIALATAMITAVFGFAASGDAMLREVMGENDYYVDIYNATLAAISAVFISIIVTASVIVVSNAFRVSASERTAQFGILKSVGATKRQIAESIVYEGIFLCAIGIPVGIAIGLLIHFTGVEIINYFLIGLNRLNEGAPLVIHFVFSWQALLLSIVVSFFTVLLSAWLPARKAARIPAIDAIRGAGEVKVKEKHIRANWLVKKLFGFEGMLASKSMKRSRRNFRATVVSLTVSVTMLIVVGSFGAMMQTTMSNFFPGIDATVGVQFFSSMTITHNIDSDGTETVTHDMATISSSLANEVAERLREYSNTPVFGAGSNYHSYSTAIPKEMMTPKMLEVFDSTEHYDDMQEISLSAAFVVTDAENYARLCELAGVPIGSNILINRYTHFVDGGREVFAPYVFDNQTLHMEGYDDGVEFDLPLHGEIAMPDIPGEVIHVSSGGVIIVVPEFDAHSYFWFASPDDKAGFIDYAENVLFEMVTKNYETAVNLNAVELTPQDYSVAVSVMDMEELLEVMQSTERLVMTFIYGFVGMLTLIGLTNVMSTISTNVRSRSREFAVLRSVGMTPGGLSRMLNLESILCSAKSLIYGVPLGVAGSYLVYRGFTSPVEYAYTVPWLPIAGCMLGVFVITWVTMRYAASRLRGGSIVESMRTEVA